VERTPRSAGEKGARRAVIQSPLVIVEKDLFNPAISIRRSVEVEWQCLQSDSMIYYPEYQQLEEYGEIWDVVVLPEREGKGVGRELLEWGLEKVKHPGLPVV